MAAVDTSDRGQLLLVAGLGLAVAIVAMALVLNSAIYTENLASRSLDSGAGDGLESRIDIERGLGGLMNQVNDPASATGYSTLETDYENGVTEWDVGASQLGALDGRAVGVTVATDGGSPIIGHGVRVVEEDETTDFTPAVSSDTDWTVAADGRARNFQLLVTDVFAAPSDSTVEADLDSANAWDSTGSFFFVDIDDGEWRLAVYGDGSGNIKLGVYDGPTDTYTICSATPAATPVRIDIGAGTVNNVPCEALGTVAKQTGPYTIHYANADQVQGTYELTVDRPIDGPSAEVGSFTDEVDRRNYGNHCGGPTYFAASSGNTPYVAPALYSSQASLNFESRSVSYDPTVRVAADELSEGAVSPHVDSFTVVDQSDSLLSLEANFSVSWAVNDPDADLDRVDVELLSGGVQEDIATTDAIDGQRTASDTVTLEDSTILPSTYDVRITVTDLDGNTRTVTQTHEADSDDTGCPP